MRCRPRIARCAGRVKVGGDLSTIGRRGAGGEARPTRAHRLPWLAVLELFRGKNFFEVNLLGDQDFRSCGSGPSGFLCSRPTDNRQRDVSPVNHRPDEAQ
jgi:hypothetical protein